MNRLTRKELPPYAKIKMKIDLKEVQDWAINEGYTDYDQYVDVNKKQTDAYQNFIQAHLECKNTFFTTAEELSTGQLERYRHLYLTEIDQNLIQTSKEKLSQSDTGNLSRLKRLNPDSTYYVPEADEYNYGLPNKHFNGEFKKLLDNFKSTLTRVRLAVLMPGADIKPHVDYDPSYITRYHIPIFTNPDVIFGYTIKNQDYTYQMEADGSVYFFNSGVKHWVKNLGTEPRLHLIVDTNGQDDLKF